MKRLINFFAVSAVAIALAAVSNLSLKAQAGGAAGGGAGAGGAGAAGAGGQTGTAGQMGTGQAGTAGQMGTGQTGTAGQMGTGQTGAAGQMGTAQTGAAGQVGQTNLQGSAGMGQNPNFIQPFGPNPWFNNPQVQMQLKLNQTQLGQLNSNYRAAQNRYVQQLEQINSARANVGTTTGANAQRNATAQSGAAGVGMGRGTGTTTGAGTANTGVATTGKGVGASAGTTGVGTGTIAAGTMAATGLTEQQRQQQMLAAQREFLATFGRDLNSVITDPQQRARFNQLQTQYQAYDALLDPTVRTRLNLSPQQVQQIEQFRQEWHNQMQQFANLPPGQREQAMVQFNALRAQFSQRMNQVLTDPQRRTWITLYGQPFDFSWDMYFPMEVNFQSAATSATTGTSGGQNNRTAPGSGIGTATNPGTGSGIGTATNPGTGSGIGTASNPGTGSGIGKGSQTDRK
jgi:hypothetical protein